MPEPLERPASDQHKLQQLFAEAHAGSDQAIGELLEGCRQYLLLVANEELDPQLQAKIGASDLVQETFLDAHRTFDRFHGHSERELLAWLRQILRYNLATLQRRYRQTQSRQVQREVPLETLDRIQDQVDSACGTPSGHAIRQEELEAFQAALERLPELYRQVILLRHRDQCAFDEIGRQTGRSTDAARMLWWRAFERLAEELEQQP